MRREKADLKVRLLSRLEKLQKVWEEASGLQDEVASAQSAISSLQEQIDEGRAEKLILKHEVQVLRNNLENHEKDVEELRARASHQSEHYDKFWRAYGARLEEA